GEDTRRVDQPVDEDDKPPVPVVREEQRVERSRLSNALNLTGPDAGGGPFRRGCEQGRGGRRGDVGRLGAVAPEDCKSSDSGGECDEARWMTIHKEYTHEQDQGCRENIYHSKMMNRECVA